MKLSVFGMAEAHGTARELAEYTAILVTILKHIADQQSESAIRSEIETLWNTIQKGRDNPS